MPRVDECDKVLGVSTPQAGLERMERHACQFVGFDWISRAAGAQGRGGAPARHPEVLGYRV